MNASETKQHFEELTQTINRFVEEVHKHKLADMATKEWSVKDILCHITFYHRHYADNYAALARGDKPELLKGSATLNKDGVQSLRHLTRKALVAQLYAANESLHHSIVVKKVSRMQYKLGSRTYSSKELMELVIRHVGKHTQQVRRSKKVDDMGSDHLND